MQNSTIEITKGTSRGKDTYGYALVTLYHDGVKISSCNGGGYDMAGTVLGEWIKKNFSAKLKKFSSNYGTGDTVKGFYGLVFYKDDGKRVHEYGKDVKVSVDGACGWSAMMRILEACGWTLKSIKTHASADLWMVMKYRKRG